MPTPTVTPIVAGIDVGKSRLVACTASVAQLARAQSAAAAFHQPHKTRSRTALQG